LPVVDQKKVRRVGEELMGPFSFNLYVQGGQITQAIQNSIDEQSATFIAENKYSNLNDALD